MNASVTPKKGIFINFSRDVAHKHEFWVGFAIALSCSITLMLVATLSYNFKALARCCCSSVSYCIQYTQLMYRRQEHTAFLNDEPEPTAGQIQDLQQQVFHDEELFPIIHAPPQEIVNIPAEDGILQDEDGQGETVAAAKLVLVQL